MEIKVRKEYGFDSEKQKYKCKIVAFLPVAEDAELKIEPLLRNDNVEFFGEKLGKYWGTPTGDEETKYNSICIKDEDIDELKEKVREFIDGEIEKLKEVIQANHQKIDTLPPCETEIWHL